MQGVDCRFCADEAEIRDEVSFLQERNAAELERRHGTRDMSKLSTGYLLADFFRFFAHEYIGGTVAIRDVSGYTCSTSGSLSGGRDSEFSSTSMAFHSTKSSTFPSSSSTTGGAAFMGGNNNGPSTSSYLFIDNPFEIGKDVANVEVTLMRSIQKELRRAAHLLWEADQDDHIEEDVEKVEGAQDENAEEDQKVEAQETAGRAQETTAGPPMKNPKRIGGMKVLATLPPPKSAIFENLIQPWDSGLTMSSFFSPDYPIR